MKNFKPKAQVLSDDEGKRLLNACLLGHGKKGVSEDELVSVIRWAEGVRADEALLELVLHGEIVITKIKKGKLVSDELIFARAAEAEIPPT